MRCQLCRHWRQFGDTNKGTCKKIGTKESNLKDQAYLTQQAILVTGYNFCCAYWELK